MFELRKQRPDDAALIELLLAHAFGPGRFARTAYRLREGAGLIDRLSFVAECDGTLVGAIAFSPISIGGAKALLLGPLVVSSNVQGNGAGFALLEKGIDVAGEEDVEAIILIGDAPYYARVGFGIIAPGAITLPGPVDPKRLLGLDVKMGALETLKGTVTPGW